MMTQTVIGSHVGIIQNYFQKLFLCWMIIAYCCNMRHHGVVLAEKGTTTNPINVESCRQDGFDPFQLTCTVCQLLPKDNNKNIIEQCQSCCLPYKTLEKRNRRHQYAVLMVPDEPNLYNEIDTLLEEDLERILEEKGSGRFIVQKTSGGGGGGGYMFQLPPAFLFWFDTTPPTTREAFVMQNEAAEMIMLDKGWKRDDMRDMILTLLPNKKK